MKKVTLYTISDSLGETSQKLVGAVTAQFPTIEFQKTYRFPFVKSPDELRGILGDALKDKAIVVTTLVDHELVAIVKEFSEKTSLQVIDLMSPFIQAIQHQTGIEPTEEAGVIHQLDQDYFNRISAIEFAVKYDDGKDPNGFLEADIVLLGISRTSKTPLSMYLANQEYKVANLPLIPEVPLPQQLKTIPKEKIIGLILTPTQQQRIRSNRLESLGLDQHSKYADPKRVEEEIKYSLDVFHDLGAFILDVSDKSIEEMAFAIIQHLDQQ